MLSFGEVVVLVAAAAWAFGPNELPRVARAAGRLTGQAAGFLYRTRAKFFKFAEETEMNKLHEEVQATMYQLNAIRSELQGGMNLFQPGPLAQRVMSVQPAPGSAAGSRAGGPSVGTQPQPQQQGAAAARGAAPTLQLEQAQHPAGPLSSGSAGYPTAGYPTTASSGGYPGQQAQPWSVPQPAHGAAAAAGAGMAAAAAGGASFAASPVLATERHQQVQRLQQLGVAVEQQDGGRQQGGQATHTGGEGEEEGVHPLTVPVSAVAAGWAPDRSGKAPTGSEVALDALAEELIAAHVLRFRQQQLAAAAQQAAAARQAGSPAAAQQAVAAAVASEAAAEAALAPQQQQQQQGKTSGSSHPGRESEL